VHRLLFQQQQDGSADVTSWGPAATPATAAALLVPASG